MSISRGHSSRRLGVAVILTGLLWQVVPAAGAEFADSSLAAAVAEAVGAPVESLTDADLAGLTQLVAWDRGITDLGGIEQLANLQVLDLADNEIEDLSPLSGLVQLEMLDLGQNRIRDLSPLAGLAQLQSLILSDNEIEDVSPLHELPLLSSVEVLRNPLSELSLTAHIPALQAKGAEVVYDGREDGGVEEAATLEWESLGPEAPEASPVIFYHVAISRSHPSVMYAITWEGVWSSKDGGQTWGRAAAMGFTHSVLVDAGDANVAYVAVLPGAGWDRPDWRTRDGGVTWEVLAIPGGGNLWAAHATRPGRVYATQVEGVGPDMSEAVDRLLISDDHGDTWQRSEVTWPHAPCALWFHPASPEMAYLSVLSGESAGHAYLADVFCSRDGGMTFESCAVSGEMVAIAPDPSAAEALYGVNRHGTWHSTDGGRNWEQRGGVPKMALDRLVVHPLNGSDVWAWTERKHDLWHSRDGGATWEHGPEVGAIRALVLHPHDPLRAYVIAAAKPGLYGLYETRDGDRTWERVSVDTRAVKVMQLSVDSEGLVYATPLSLDYPGLWVLPVGGETWIAPRVPEAGGFFLPSLLWADPRHPGTVYAFDVQKGWIRSADHGGSWQALELSSEHSWEGPRQPVAASPEGEEVYYAVDPADAGLYRSADNGLTWARVAGDVGVFGLGSGTSGTMVVSGPGDPAIRLTEDGGETWEVVGTVPSGGQVLDLAIHPLRPDRAYVASGDGLYALSLVDGSWEHLRAARVAWSRRVRIGFDPGDAGDVCVMSEVELWESGDGGRTWTSLIGVPGAPLRFHDMAMDPQDPRTVYVATPEGVYRLQRAAPPTAVEELRGVLPTAFALQPNYPNPFNAQTVIGYSVPAASWVELAVYNVLGQRVVELVQERQRAGLHRVMWEGRDESGGELATGMYLCRLRAGGKVAARRMLLLR